MNQKTGIWLAAGALAALGAYFIFKQQANAATLPVTSAGAGGSAPGAAGSASSAAGGTNLATATGLTSGGLTALSPSQLSNPLPAGIASLVTPQGTTAYYTTTLTAPTATTVTASGNFWNTLTPIAAPSGGWLIDPSGSQAPAYLLPWRQDSNGVKYVMWGVDVYQAQGPDSNGNYVGVPVAGTSSASAVGF